MANFLSFINQIPHAKDVDYVLLFDNKLLEVETYDTELYMNVGKVMLGRVY